MSSSQPAKYSPKIKISPNSKKRRFVPQPAEEVMREVSCLSSGSNVRLLHQDIKLSFIFQRSLSETKWIGEGYTVLYLRDDAENPNGNLALHLRRTCQIEDIKVEIVGRVGGDKVDLVSTPVLYHHVDPLANVLIKPPQSYTEDDVRREETLERFAADSQCSRGSSGFMTGLRVASIASNMGELRLMISDPSRNDEDDLGPKARKKIRLSRTDGKSTPVQDEKQSIQLNVTKEEAHEVWNRDLKESFARDSTALSQMEKVLVERSSVQRDRRIKLVSTTLADSSLVEKSDKPTLRAYKITMKYKICLNNDEISHLGGFHSISNSDPHIYTTTGVLGDHEGPRNWLPCLDSASTKHRASRRFHIVVTAPMQEGLSTVGCGEDYGVRKTFLHEKAETDSNEEISKVFGNHHWDLVKNTSCSSKSSSIHSVNESTKPNVVPLDTNFETTIDSILATSLWSSNIWMPVPARSLGFAIGPFKVVEDSEYFSVEEDLEGTEGLSAGDDEKADMEEEEEERIDKERELLEESRKNGEGIRQIYFAPLFERKYLFENSDMSLIPGATIDLKALASHQVQHALDLDSTVASATAGVPHRALSLFRDILALPSYRTSSYTQIWIPNAVHGGCTSGALHCSPEVLVNPFLGGGIMDSRMLPPVKSRLPYHGGGRVLQFLQARNAMRGWITAALPLGGDDDVGYGYIYSLIESFLMSLYERGHGTFGEGGAKGTVYFTKRYSVGSGLNSSNLDFLPVKNIEENENDLGPIPTDDRNTDQLWRTVSNGTESHTSALDEYTIRQVLIGDVVETLERGTETSKGNVPLPSFGWTGSHLSLSFLSSTACSSSEVGCGAVELAHPIGGLLYRTLKGDVLRRITEGRAGISNLVRVIRAGFIAAYLGDIGEKKLKWNELTQKKQKDSSEKSSKDESKSRPPPPFVVSVDNLLSTGGFTHTLFTRLLRLLAGEIKGALLRGTLVDIEQNVRSTTTNRQFVEPEGFPNSFVRGASMPYLRVGAHVEQAGADGNNTVGNPKGTQLHVLVEPATPDGGISFCGPMNLRVIENEGQVREVEKMLNNGSRSDWGPIYLHTKAVTSAKEQTMASGVIEASTASKDKKEKEKNKTGGKDAGVKSVLATVAGGEVFDENILHIDGYQAIELLRLTNRTPLLWIRVDPQCLYGGKISVFQPDACLAEQLFHDGDASAQVEAIRALAERPFKIQGSVKITNVHNVKVSELPVRLLGDCLRASPALHGDLPHTPAIRAQAALGIGQWQNNQAPGTKESVDTDWLGVNLLMQYFKERYYKNGIIMPIKFNRIALKKNAVEVLQQSTSDGTAGKANRREADDYVHLDTIEENEKQKHLAAAEEIEVEEDEEYRVRASVISAIAAVRAKDGTTPPKVLDFLLTVLNAGDISMVGEIDTDIAEAVVSNKSNSNDTPQQQQDKNKDDIDKYLSFIQNSNLVKLQYIPSVLIADALLSLCSINTAPATITDPKTGKLVQSSMQHPVHSLLVASQRWLEWELYKETIRTEMDRSSHTGVGGNCYNSVTASGVAALSTLAILCQTTTDRKTNNGSKNQDEEADANSNTKSSVYGTQFYMDIFEEEPRRPDITRAACAQAIACICCAADRFKGQETSPNAPALGLLTALEFLLQKIIDPRNSPGLRQTLALLMLDTCTGKVSYMQRVAVIGSKSDLAYSGARFYGGPLGASNGNDNGSALLTTVTNATNPVANAVNDGARRGLKLLGRAGHSKDESKDDVVVRVAIFATDLWRTMNGHRIRRGATRPSSPSKNDIDANFDITRDGVCANDGILRCTLLALWQWVWPKTCHPIWKVQNWRQHEATPRYKNLGADKVLKYYTEETIGAESEERSFDPLTKIVKLEIDRQNWRGLMVSKAYEHSIEDTHPTSRSNNKDESMLDDILPPILRDPAFMQGGWVTSTSKQRRKLHLDGGVQVTNLNLRVKGSD